MRDVNIKKKQSVHCFDGKSITVCIYGVAITRAHREHPSARAYTKQASKQARHMTMHDGAKSMSTYQTIQ